MTVLVVGTLLPVLLATVGPRLDWPHRRHGDRPSRLWSAWTRGVVRRRWLAVGAALLILGALVFPLSTLVLGDPSADALASSGPAYQGLRSLETSGIGAGVLSPIDVLSTPSDAAALTIRLGQVHGVRGAVAPATDAWRGNGTALIAVLPTADSATAGGRATLDRVRQAAHAGPAHGRVGGIAAGNADFASAVYGNFPLMVFAFLFGLSMDYEVFILSRMREEYDATGSTDAAVIRGIGHTGRLVTSAAMILMLTFVAMASGPQTEIKMLATGLAAGIFLDATVIRMLLVPALVSLLGRWNWWLPAFPAKLLGVQPSLRGQELGSRASESSAAA